MSTQVHPLVSMIVLNYNGKQMLERCLSSIINQTFSDFEIIFVDNASTDGSVAFVKQKYPNDSRIRTIVNDRNYGPVRGLNIGASLSKGEYVAFLNNDIELDSNWLATLVSVLESDTSIGAASSKQLLMQDARRLQGIGSFIDPYGFNFQEGEGEIDVGQYGRMREIFHGGTTALIVRRQTLERVGLLDCTFEYGLDDGTFWANLRAQTGKRPTTFPQLAHAAVSLANQLQGPNLSGVCAA